MVNFRWLNTHAKIKIILIVKTKKINTMKEFFIGIDVSKRTLDCVLYDSDNRKMGAQNHKKITNNQDGCDMLMAWIKEQGINKRKLLVCMEHTGEPSYYFARLLEKRMQDFTLIPAMLIKSAFAGERGKNDKVDAIRIARYAHLHRENLTPTHLKDDKILRIKGLMNDRAMAIKCRTMYKNIMSEVRDVVSEFRHKNAERNVAYFDKQVSEIEKEIKHLIHSNEELEHRNKELEKALYDERVLHFYDRYKDLEKRIFSEVEQLLQQRRDLKMALRRGDYNNQTYERLVNAITKHIGEAEQELNEFKEGEILKAFPEQTIPFWRIESHAQKLRDRNNAEDQKENL